MDNVAVRDVGDKLVLFSEEEFALRRVIAILEQDGATIVRKPSRVGNKWTAAIKPDPSLDH